MKTVRAAIPEIKTVGDLDRFTSEHGWALLSRSSLQPSTMSVETYLTPSGRTLSFSVWKNGKVELEG